MVGALLLVGTAQAGGDPAAGKAKAVACFGCHGENGIGAAPVYPNLAGQSGPYLELALKAYRERKRAGGNAAVMYPMAANLSDEDIADIAAYFSSLPCGR
jgi:cytochrome c553